MWVTWASRANAVWRSHASHLFEGQFTDRAGSVGRAVHPAIMEHHRIAVSRRPDINLDEVDAQCDGLRDGRQRVPRDMPGGPTMSNPKRHAIPFRSTCGGGE